MSVKPTARAFKRPEFWLFRGFYDVTIGLALDLFRWYWPPGQTARQKRNKLIVSGAFLALLVLIILNPSTRQSLINGLVIGGTYSIFALGYTLIFSILRIINFAHGAVFTLGAYFAYFLMGLPVNANGLLANQQLPFGLPFWAAMVLGGLLAGLVAVGLDRIAFRPVRRRGSDPLFTLVLSLGVAVAIINLIQYLVSAETYSFGQNPLGLTSTSLRFNFPWEKPPAAPVVIVRTVQVVIFIVSMIIVVLLTYLMNRTKLGKALRAVSEDTTTASLLGINTDRLITITFFLSGLVGGVAGILVAVNVNIKGPYFGVEFGLKGLSVIILGGLGDVPGAVVGGLVIGLAEAFVPASASAFKEAVAFTVLFAVLLIRPQGLLGRSAVQKV